MGKLGGDELNYSSHIDLILVYGDDGETTGGSEGSVSNGRYFAEAAKAVVAAVESMTDEGYAFRVDLRLRPEGRSGALILSREGYRAYFADRAELWERQALIKARFSAGDGAVAARFFELVRPFVFRPGLDEGIVADVRHMKQEIDRAQRAKGAERRNVKLGRGGIREVEFLAQALQLLYAGDDPWLRGGNTRRALFRLTERGYLSPGLGRMLGDSLVFLRNVEHRLQLLHGSRPPTWPEAPRALALLARRMGIALPPDAARRRFLAEYRRVTGGVHAAFREFFEARPTPRGVAPPRIPTFTALKATGFADPDRARQNLRLVLEGRPLLPYPARASAALARMLPVLLDALWQSPDPDEALNQFERFVSAAGPRTAWLELLAHQPPLLTNPGPRVAHGGGGRGAASRRAARRGRPLHRCGDRGSGEARRPRAHYRIRPRPLRDLRPRRHDGRGRAHRSRRLLSPGGGGAAIPPRRYHRGRHRLPGGPPSPARLQGQHLRGQRRLHGAVLSRVGRPLGATDAHAGPAGRGGPRRGPPGTPPRDRAALRAGGGRPRPQGDTHAARADGEGAGQGETRALSREVRPGGPGGRGGHHPGDPARPWPPPPRHPATQHAAGHPRHRRRRAPVPRGRRRAGGAVSLPPPCLGRPAPLRRTAVGHARAGGAVPRPRGEEPPLSVADGFPRGLPGAHRVGARAVEPRGAGIGPRP